MCGIYHPTNETGEGVGSAPVARADGSGTDAGGCGLRSSLSPSVSGAYLRFFEHQRARRDRRVMRSIVLAAILLAGSAMWFETRFLESVKCVDVTNR